ncbi:MAG: rod-binding protein [Eubacterium sp.]|nr:rod-binding protein [Eubacterium sp.]
MAITLDPTLSMMNAGSVYNNAQLQAANKLSEQIEGASNDEDTLQACKDFEAYMLEQIFKRMSESAKLLGDDEEEDATSHQYVEMFEDNYYQEIAKQMMASGQGVGIAEQLYQSITNQKLGISADTTTAAMAAKEAAQSASTGASELAALTGLSTEDIESMTAKQKAEAAALAAESSFASSLLSSGE